MKRGSLPSEPVPRLQPPAQIEANRDRMRALVLRFEAEGSWDVAFVDHLRFELELKLREQGILKESVTRA